MNAASGQTPTLRDLRITFVRVLATISIAIAGLGIVPNAIATFERSQFGPGLIVIALFLVANSLWLILVDRGKVEAASLGLVATLVIGSFSPAPAFQVIAVTAAIASAVLFSQRLYLAANVILLLRVAIGALEFLRENPTDILGVGPAFVIPLTVIAVASISTRYFFNSAQRTAITAQRSANLLRSTADIAQDTSQILELQPLLTQATERISRQLGFYHTQVFLVDSRREYARLVASTGEVGQQLLARGHRLAVGSQSVIGQVTAEGRPVIARDSDPQNVRFRNELLPLTRAELALPIFDGTQVIGALDVQSQDDEAFTETDVQSLQVLSNLLATAIRNAQLFERQAQTAEENARLYTQAQESISEIERLNRELTGKVWQDYLRASSITPSLTLVNGEIHPDSAWTPAMDSAAKGKTVRQLGDEETILALPIQVRGQVVGVVELALEETLTNEELASVQELIQRFAMSLENARLYEVAQAASGQEQRLNDITARYQRVGSIDELLRITLNELGETLGAQRGAIRLGDLPAEAVHGESA